MFYGVALAMRPGADRLSHPPGTTSGKQMELHRLYEDKR
jgi:hypothetical protein